MSSDAALWGPLEARLRTLDPALSFLRPPASRAALARHRVPPAWEVVWGRHDGQGGGLDGLFEGWFFLPLDGPVDSVEAEADAVRDGWLPLAKDFGGEHLVVDRATGRVLHLSEGQEPLEVWAEGPEALFARTVAAFDARPPQLQRQQPDGRWRRVSDIDVALPIAGWEVGGVRAIGGGVVAVRLHPPALLDGLDDVAEIRWMFSLDTRDGGPCPAPSAPRLEGERPVWFSSRGGLYWVEAWGGGAPPLDATLRFEVDLAERTHAPGPLGALARARSSHERAVALYRLGAIDRALAALDRRRGVDPALRCALLSELGRVDQAAAEAERVPVGAPVRIRALSRAGRHAEAAAEARRGTAFADRWRLAEVLEAAGDVAGAVAALLEARSTTDHEARLVRLATRIRALEAQRPPPPQRAVTEEVVAVTLGPDRSGVVRLTPAQAAAGALAQVGDAVVRLPAGAGHGVRARFPGLAPDGETLTLEVGVVLPEAWAPADNPTLTFDRWDTVATVPPAAAASGRVRVAGVDAVHELDWPPGAAEVRVAGGGLARRDGRGDLVVRIG